RDRDTDQRLDAAGWRVVRVWEHEDMAAAAEQIRALLVEPGWLVPPWGRPTG
ncbi:MAG: very short patch repair endonuclease, partial [Nocardioidaceae bacterium]|nr:very short patch repair endonuclease [Nocardioidaceae bacterium]